MDQTHAEAIIESLRKGLPPVIGVNEYSAGDTKFLASIKARHLQKLSDVGSKIRSKIRFVSGSWGSGKTHLLARIREMSFDSNCLVSSIQLDRNAVPFEHFERLFYGIIKRISIPSIDQSTGLLPEVLLSEVFRKHLFGVYSSESIETEACEEACKELMSRHEIDIDFRRIVCEFWRTYLPTSGDTTAREERRGKVMNWFGGLGTIASYRREFNVQKMVTRETARDLLVSLARYARYAGYSGIVVLLDEAETNFSTMRKSQLDRAHNNLLHLINTIQESIGIFVVFASTPDFFTDERYGIKLYGALAQRIGTLPTWPPIAVQTVWNLDYMDSEVTDYQLVAWKLRSLYSIAYPMSDDSIGDRESLDQFVSSLCDVFPPYGHVRFWRFLVQAVIRRFDMEADGSEVPYVQQLYSEVASLAEQG